MNFNFLKFILVTLALFQMSAYVNPALAANPMAFVCDDGDCGTGKGDWVELVILILLVAIGVLFGSSKIRVTIALIFLPTIFLVSMFGPVWILAIYPMLIVAGYLQEHVLKFLGIQDKEVSTQNQSKPQTISESANAQLATNKSASSRLVSESEFCQSSLINVGKQGEASVKPSTYGPSRLDGRSITRSHHQPGDRFGCKRAVNPSCP